MSALAKFTLLPSSAVKGLRDAALEQKANARARAFAELLRKSGRDVVDYKWSGWVFGTLLAYLDEKRGINLASSDAENLADFLTDTLCPTYFVLTPKHKLEHIAGLRRDGFSEAELTAYYNEFNETEELDIGKAMLDGIDCLHRSLAAIDEQSFVLFHVG